MGRIKTPKVVAPVEALENPEEWSYFTDVELMKSRGNSVCLNMSSSSTSNSSRGTSHKALPELAKEEGITNWMVSRSCLTNQKLFPQNQ